MSMLDRALNIIWANDVAKKKYSVIILSGGSVTKYIIKEENPVNLIHVLH
jgi:hypothetical protein